MICLKKELLRACASSSLIYVLCVITLWQRYNAWQGQSSVQDKFCSKQTQPLLQTDLPLHVHTRSCKKSDDIWSSNNISSRPNFPSFQPCPKGDPTAGFGICAFNNIFCFVRRSKNMLFKCVFTQRKSHQSRIFDSCQFYPQFVQIDMASFRLSLRIIQPWWWVFGLDRLNYLCQSILFEKNH